MVTDPKRVAVPKAYTELPYTQIRVSHVPAESQEATPVVLVTLYRPGKHNAFTPTMQQELEDAFQRFDVDDRVKAIVVTGDGKMFCAGADLEAGFVGGQVAVRDHRDGGGRVTLAIHNCRKPTIAAIQGSAVGVGITMTLPMSIRVAYEKAKIGFVFARRGIVMEACSSYYLPRLIGMSRAMHLVTTGAVYEARNALLSNLFSETLPTPEQVLPRALEIADEVAKNTSTVSTYLMRELMYRDSGSPEGQHLLDSRVLYDLFGSTDNTEGVKAFFEKRPVNFTGNMQKDAPSAYPWWEPLSVANRPVAESYKFKAKI